MRNMHSKQNIGCHKMQEMLSHPPTPLFFFQLEADFHLASVRGD